MTRLSSFPSVLDGYTPPGHVFDEVIGEGGEMRPHWRTFDEGFAELGPEEFRSRWHEAQQLIHENGITYNVYGDPRGLDRPWQLDPIPLIIAPSESERIEEGLIQRVRLLEAILADLYGPQQLLHKGLLPPELVFANSGFLRPCHGIKLPNRRFLYLTAFDLGRGPDGTLYVLGDRTQAPSGAGYTLENRIVMVRMLPEVFRRCRVQRLACFFRNLRDTLRQAAPHNRDQPRTVLLTPGPYNETYFEHAYLARYLGFTLAEGGDLTVRDHRLYLKLLDGLQPVDVVCRRLDDDFCDPLELRADSFLGIPGLVQAVRAGNVVIANALGSGLAESPALLPYLPNLCRHLFGEALLIPSVPAWWCGDPVALSHVLAHLPSMVIKAAFPSMRLDPVFPSSLSEQKRQELIEKIKAQPHLYVGQERLDLSTTPVLTETGLSPRHTVSRFYLGAHESSFALMPGGLTRVTPSIDSMIVSLQKGGGSKDTWVLTEGPVDEFSMLRGPGQAMELSRGGNDLPSRAADNLFWLGRYVQRAEDLVRLLRVIFVRLTERSGFGEVPELPALLSALTQITQTFPGFIGEGAEERLAAPENELFSLIFQPDKVNSLVYNIRSIHRAAGSVRDRLSMDMWRTLSHLPPDLPYDPYDPPTLADVLDLLNARVIGLAGFGGIAMESMSRGHGWRFLEMGRKIEHAWHQVGLLRWTLRTTSSCEIPLLEALLDVADSSITYRRRYLAGVQAAPVLDLLIADDSNPRSLIFQLLALRDVIDQLPRDAGHAGLAPEQRLILGMVTQVQLANIEELVQVHDPPLRPHLDAFFANLDRMLPMLSDAIAHHYLSHLQPSRQLAGSPERLP
jgi:uncharacterized circularly permuted ATP-grasp superfamily protein/uncharacterized alpha-E superfamily protein